MAWHKQDYIDWIKAHSTLCLCVVAGIALVLIGYGLHK